MSNLLVAITIAFATLWVGSMMAAQIRRHL
jgi:hypothetical protein